MPAGFDHIGELLDGCARHGIRQLWCYDVPNVRSWQSSMAHGEWDVQLGCAAPWVHCFRHGSDDECDLIYPSLDPDSPWRRAGSALELLNALQLYRRYVEMDWRRSPGAMATNLLKRLQNRHPNAIPLELAEKLPPPAEMGGIEGPARWIRPLSDAETRMGWIHSYDRNGAYLAACADLDVGAGAVRHVDGGRHGWLSEKEAEAPGYFLVDVAEMGPISALSVPGRTGEQWVSAPTLKLLRQRGAMTVQVKEAYVWEEKHQPLKAWYETLRDARAALMDDELAGASLALGAVKETYRAFNGWIASRRWDRSGDALYRPDIRDAMVATARCNLIRRAYKCLELDGVLPLALGGVDGLYIVSDEPDPIKAAPPSITLGKTLKDFKPNPSIQLTRDWRDLLSGDAPANKRLAALVKAAVDAKRRGE